MKSHYARHSSKLDISTSFKKRLYDEEKIFIHYPHYPNRNPPLTPETPDNASLNPAAYPIKDGHVVRRFINLAKSGGYVFADYGTGYVYKVGIIQPDSTVSPEHGEWGNKWQDDHRPATVKALQLTDVETLTPEEAILFKLGRPRQGTLCQWRAIRKRLAFRLTGKPSDFNLSYLTPDQQEVMCGEFLRSDLATQHGLSRIATYLTPIGRTRADIDIYGLTAEGRKVIAQVTYRGVTTGKIESLKQFKDNHDNSVIYFCNPGGKKTAPNHIKIFPLEKVYESFCQNSTQGQRWLKEIMP
jgi:hypothetical protein